MKSAFVSLCRSIPLGAFACATLLLPGAEPIQDEFTPLPPKAIRFHGYLENRLQASLVHWNKGVVPYSGMVEMFRSGRKVFAQGEMWGKAVRSGSLFYRYTLDPELKAILQKTVADLLTTKRPNGFYSCSEPAKQPDGPGGDIWERTHLMLGLEEYYRDVEQDPAVLEALLAEGDGIVAQIGPAPRAGLEGQGWSPNHIESSSILEPMLALYKLSGKKCYLDFARYVVEDEGGAKGYNIVQDALADKDPEQIGGPYPKAYEMMSLFEGVSDYYRVTGDERWKRATLNLYRKIGAQEITIIGNGGGDQPYHPDVLGEAWDRTAVEQANPKIQRMMETCVGVSWLRLCNQILRLTGDPGAVDEIERYAYNGLIGAMTPSGNGFSYVNLLNGVKTNPEGWGAVIANVSVTCCNLSGPCGLAYLPQIAIMNSRRGPVINLYSACSAVASTPAGRPVGISIATDFPRGGLAVIALAPRLPEKFPLRLRIPAWSKETRLLLNHKPVPVVPGTYAELVRKWSTNDIVELTLDMRCRLLDSPHGSNRAADNHRALVRGPIVLARDENLDPNYNQPVEILANGGYVDVVATKPQLPTTHLEFRVPTRGGSIEMSDYASINNWNGKHVCTWLPR